MAVYILIKGFGFAIIGFLTWFTFEASVRFNGQCLEHSQP
jgi:hypothetical protein